MILLDYGSVHHSKNILEISQINVLAIIIIKFNFLDIIAQYLNYISKDNHV